jgi:CRP/FNR family cyclic AMP-dependent transcriptional regulator
VDWLQELSEDEIGRLRRGSTYRDYEKGETVFTPDGHPHSLYLLERGLVRIYRLSSDGAETTFGYVAPGEVFGELSMLGDYPRESFALAVHRSRVWRIPRELFLDVVGSRPAVVLEVTRQIGQRLKRIESRVENLVFRDVRSRIAHMLLELAEDFGRPRDSHLVLDLELTQSELATLVGSARQTINATLKDLETEGLIGREGRRIILFKPQELERIARSTLGRD